MLMIAGEVSAPHTQKEGFTGCGNRERRARNGANRRLVGAFRPSHTPARSLKSRSPPRRG